MFSLVTILLAGIALVSAQWPAAAPSWSPPAAPNPYANMIVSSIQQDTVGNFGYQTADGQSRSQTVGADGSIRGSYSYPDATGRLVNVNYIADRHGYRAVGDNIPAHAQHVPAPDPSAHAYRHTPAAAPSWTPQASVAPTSWSSTPSHSVPYPLQHRPSWSPAPNPALQANPAAEAQLAQTVAAHASNDARLQAQQLQQLDSITRAGNLHTPAHHASVYSPFFG